MSNKLLSLLPLIVPVVAVAAVGSGALDLFGAKSGATDSEQVVSIEAEIAPAEPEIVAVAAPEPAAPANVSDQLAALLTEEAAAPEADVEVTRTTGFSIDVLENATEAALDEGNVLNGAAPVVEAAVTQETVEPQVPAVQDTGAVDNNFFTAAQANLAAANSCVNDLRNLASQAKVYFPSGALTGEASGIAQARLIGTIAARCEGVSIEVQGHSDPSGDPAINLRLSQERAESVIARISAAGIDTTRFFAVGLGSARPSGVIGPEGAAYYDRRVEFAVVENLQNASLTTGGFTPAGTVAACVVGLQSAVEQVQIAYTPGSVTVSPEDMQSAMQLARLAVACPQARLRVVGQHSDQFGSVEDPSTGRLRAIALITSIVGGGIDSSQIIMAAPGNTMPAAGLNDSRVDFDVILEDS